MTEQTVFDDPLFIVLCPKCKETFEASRDSVFINGHFSSVGPDWVEIKCPKCKYQTVVE